MPTKSQAPNAEERIWDRVLQFDEELTPTAARALLKLHFSVSHQERMDELAAKARAGALSPKEEQLIDTYERLGCVLDILHSQSRRVLKRRRRATA